MVPLRPKEKAFGAGRRTGGRFHSPYMCVLLFIGGAVLPPDFHSRTVTQGRHLRNFT